MSKRAQGQVIKRGRDRYLVRIFVGRDENGKRQYTSETVSGTLRDAERAKIRLLAAVGAGEVEVSPTLADFLDEWLETVAKVSVSPRSYQNYKRDLGKYVKPKLGKVRLAELTSRQIQTIYSDLDAKGFSPNTIRLAHAPLRQALQCAVTWGLIPANPTIGTKRPKIRRVERQTLTVEQVQHFLATYRDDKWYALWVVLLFAGLRPGEVVGLKWIDLRGNRLTIRRSITELEDRKWGVGDLKTKGSVGVITLPQIAVEALQEHRNRHPVSSHGWIFADDDGGYLLPDTISDYWRRLLKKAGLPAMRLYDTRHTHATLLLTAGVNPKVVSSRLRHASVAITLDTYSHVLPSIDEEAADTLDEMLGDKR